MSESMAWVRRRRRRRTATLSTMTRQYLAGFLWLGIGLAVIAFMAGLGAILPSVDISLGSGQNAITISSSIFYNVIGFAIGVLFLIQAVRRLLRLRI